MKLSMSILAECLSPFKPQLFILDGENDISGIRFYAESLPEYAPDNVYIGQARDVFEGADYENAVLLVSGLDIIVVHDESLETVVNAVLLSFDKFNSWEASLWEAAASQEGLQKILDLSADIFGGMLGFASIDGQILAYRLIDELDANDVGWEHVLEKKTVPVTMTSTRLQTSTGQPALDFSDRPQIFSLGEGRNFIASYLKMDGECVATVYIQEKRRPFTKGDIKIAEVLCSALTQFIANSNALETQSLTSLFFDLVERNYVDPTSIEILNARLKLIMPLVVVSFRNIVTQNIMAQKQLVTSLQTLACNNHSFVHASCAVSIVGEQDLSTFLAEAHALLSPPHNAIGVSLPFSSWDKLVVGYRQSQFALDWNHDKPGIFYSKDYVFVYLLKLINQLNYDLELVHPALGQLREYDTSNKTDLYQTLFVYLENERNVVATAKKLFIHRNTLMERIKRIEKLTTIDLSDSVERTTLMLSFLLAQ